MSPDAVLRDRRIWRFGRESPVVGESISTGFVDLDARLPVGGWPLGALTEIIAPRAGIGALSLLMPALARLSRADRWLAWIDPPYIPYAPALTGCGIELARVLMVRGVEQSSDRLWAIEQSLRSGTCSAVLAWLRNVDTRALRRLQLAAETGRGWGVLFRPSAALRERTPAALRLCLETDRRGYAVHILKRRGGSGASIVPLHPGCLR